MSEGRDTECSSTVQTNQPQLPHHPCLGREKSNPWPFLLREQHGGQGSTLARGLRRSQEVRRVDSAKIDGLAHFTYRTLGKTLTASLFCKAYEPERPRDIAQAVSGPADPP